MNKIAFKIYIFFLTAFQLMGNSSASQIESGEIYDQLDNHYKEKFESENDNSYEVLIGGGISAIVGTIGIFTNDNKILQTTYSGIQSIGIMSIGFGSYEVLTVDSDSLILNLHSRLNKYDSNKPDFQDIRARELIRIHAANSRAKRISFMATSGLLTLQFLSNALLVKNLDKDLRQIYYFLGGVNSLILGHTLFFKTDYETMDEKFSDKKGKNFGYYFLPINKKVIAGLTFSF